MSSDSEQVREWIILLRTGDGVDHPLRTGEGVDILLRAGEGEWLPNCEPDSKQVEYVCRRAEGVKVDLLQTRDGDRAEIYTLK